LPLYVHESDFPFFRISSGDEVRFSSVFTAALGVEPGAAVGVGPHPLKTKRAGNNKTN